MNKYTKTQRYMQCDTVLVKNLVGRLGAHNKTRRTMGKSSHTTSK